MSAGVGVTAEQLRGLGIISDVGSPRGVGPSGKTLRAQRRKAERAATRASAARRRTEPTDAQLGFAYLSKLRAESAGFRNVIENGELQ